MMNLLFENAKKMMILVTRKIKFEWEFKRWEINK